MYMYNKSDIQDVRESMKIQCRISQNLELIIFFGYQYILHLNNF